MFANIIICTLMMWGLTAIAVIPLTKWWVAKAAAGNPTLASASVADPKLISEDAKAKLQKLYSTKFIQADVLVMGTAGFIAGLAGFPLIGFAWKAKAWPGLLALIGSSFLGYHLTGGRA